MSGMNLIVSWMLFKFCKHADEEVIYTMDITSLYVRQDWWNLMKCILLDVHLLKVYH